MIEKLEKEEFYDENIFAKSQQNNKKLFNKINEIIDVLNSRTFYDESAAIDEKVFENISHETKKDVL